MLTSWIVFWWVDISCTSCLGFSPAFQLKQQKWSILGMLRVLRCAEMCIGPWGAHSGPVMALAVPDGEDCGHELWPLSMFRCFESFAKFVPISKCSKGPTEILKTYIYRINMYKQISQNIFSHHIHKASIWRNIKRRFFARRIFNLPLASVVGWTVTSTPLNCCLIWKLWPGSDPKLLRRLRVKVQIFFCEHWCENFYVNISIDI